MRRPGLVFRNRFVQSVTGAGVALFIGIGLAIALDPKAPFYLGGIVGTVGAYLAWMLGWQSSVRLGPDGVEVNNLFMTGKIPWGIFREFRVANGLRVVMSNGRSISSFAFGGSVLGQLTGYRGMARVVERMEAYRRELAGQRAGAGVPAGDYQRGVRIAVWPLLAFAVPLELVGVLTSLLR